MLKSSRFTSQLVLCVKCHCRWSSAFTTAQFTKSDCKDNLGRNNKISLTSNNNKVRQWKSRAIAIWEVASHGKCIVKRCLFSTANRRVSPGLSYIASHPLLLIFHSNSQCLPQYTLRQDKKLSPQQQYSLWRIKSLEISTCLIIKYPAKICNPSHLNPANFCHYFRLNLRWIASA